MKKLIAILLSLILAFGVTACGNMTEEEITSAVVDAIISGIEDGLQESFSQTDDDSLSQTESEKTEESEKESESKNEEIEITSEADPGLAPDAPGNFTPDPDFSTEPDSGEAEDLPLLDEYGAFYSKDDVALYIHVYGKLPPNFITKEEARDLGWEGGSVEKACGESLAIGGDKFGNREGLLPKAKGRQYNECDIDTLGKDSRGAKRIVFSNDGLIYYTDDHYESFTLLYGEE